MAGLCAFPDPLCSSPYPQLKEDFIHDWLYPPVSVNNAIWMVAADMAKEAIEKKRQFNDFR